MTVLVGDNAVNVALSSIVTVVFVTYFSAGIAVTAPTVAVSVVVLVFGEIAVMRAITVNPDSSQCQSYR